VLHAPQFRHAHVSSHVLWSLLRSWASEVQCLRVAGLCRIAEQESRAAEQEAAATSGRIGTEEDIRKAAAKSTPYTAPGGRWSSFRSYSVWQRSFMIWGFAIKFFFKLWLVGKKFTYGKKVCFKRVLYL